ATTYTNAFDKLKKFREDNPGWVIGGFGYDLKNDIETLASNNKDALNFPDCFFYVPQHLLLIKGNELQIISNKPHLYEEILSFVALPKNPSAKHTILVQER